MKKYSAAVIILCFIFLSCASTVHLPVPGEGETIRKNISIEYMTIADAYNDLAKYDKAAQYYRLAMKNRNLYWTAYYKLGRCYAMSKNWTEARKVYSEILKRDPDNLSIKISLAYLTAMEGKLEAAESVYALLWKENQDSAEILVNYVDVLLANEKYDDAEQKLSVLKEKFKDNKNISVFEKKLEEKNPKKLQLDEKEKDNVIKESSE